MKKFYNIFIFLLLVILTFVNQSYAANKFFPFIGLTGTGTEPGNPALDGRAVAGLSNGDYAYGYSSSSYYMYQYDSASVDSESVPGVITPNDSAGAGRWILLNPPNPDFVQLNPTTAPSHSEGLFYYDSDKNAFTAYNEEADFSQQMGQEGIIPVYNNTGSTIADGKICYLSGAGTYLSRDGFTVALADSSDATKCLGTIGWSTHSIENGSWGYITRWGLLNNQNTTGQTASTQLWLSATSPGDYVVTPPTSPNYLIGVGTMGIIDGTVGTIDVSISIGSNTGGVIKIFNGSVLEDTTTTISSNGSAVTLSYEQNGGGDLSLFLNGGFIVFDSTPAATVSLTPGSDTSPQMNYIYIPESTMVLTNSTSGFPTTQHIPVATAYVQSAASAQTDGVMKFHAWTDHLSDISDQGHLYHVNKWIRNQPSTWEDGVIPTTTITTNPSAIDNVYFSNTSGNILQLHTHLFPAIDTATTGHIHAINDPITSYRKVEDLSDLDLDSEGVSLRSNNTYYSIVIWGVVSETTADSQLYCNLPSGSYSSSVDATTDPLRYSNYTVPAEFRGTGFLIARVTLRYQTADSGTLTEINTEDLRGLFPSTSAGGGGSGSGTSEFSDNIFNIFNVADNTKKINFDGSNITTGNTRTITMLDADTTLIQHDGTDASITGEFTAQTFTTTPVVDPTFRMYDSDMPGADKENFRLKSNYVSGADGAENTSFSLWAWIAGTATSIFDYNPTTDSVDFDRPTTFQNGDIKENEIASPTIITSTVTSGTHSISFADGGAHTITINQNVAISITNWTVTGTRPVMMIKTIQSGGDYTVTIEGNTVDLTASGSDMIIAWTDDGGTTVNAYVAKSNIN